MAEQKFKSTGIIKSVGVSEGTKQNGDTWKRASIKIEKDGKDFTVSTFDINDIDKANALNGKEVEAIYTKSKDGKYKNLEKGGLKDIGPAITEDEIIDLNKPEVQKSIKTETPKVETGVNWDLKNKRQFRAMCISYAKDLAVAGKIEVTAMKSTAEIMFEFVWEGYNEDIPANPEEEPVM